MDLLSALTGQYRATLAMLRQCVERCPDDLWNAGRHPRTFWRIAYHAAFYTDLYLAPAHDQWTPWSRHQSQARVLWDDDPEGLPPREATYSPAEIAGYIDELTESVGARLAQLDLGAQESGFPWYPIPKLDHIVLNLRHLGVHVGQLQEQLYAKGVDLDWISVR